MRPGRLSRIAVPFALTVLAGASMSRAHDPIESSLETVARFLELAPDQLEATTQLLRERHEATAPIRREITHLERELEVLLEGGGEPGAIGVVVLEIHDRRSTIAAIHAETLSNFESLLNDEQGQRLSSARAAKKLQPVLPAFTRLGLL